MPVCLSHAWMQQSGKSGLQFFAQLGGARVQRLQLFQHGCFALFSLLQLIN